MPSVSLHFHEFNPCSSIEPISLEINSTWVINLGLLIPSQSFIRNQKTFMLSGERRPLAALYQRLLRIFVNQAWRHLSLSACLPTVGPGHLPGDWQLSSWGSHLQRFTWQPSQQLQIPDILSPFSSLFPGEPCSRLKKFLLVWASPCHSASFPRPCPSSCTFAMSYEGFFMPRA